MIRSSHYLSFQRIISEHNFIGDNDREGTPVPIPNTEVKLSGADDSECENRTLPIIFFCIFLSTFIVDFLFYMRIENII